MIKMLCFAVLLSVSVSTFAQTLVTPFERSRGKASATYFEALEVYRALATKYSTIHITEKGTTDAGYPLHVVTYSADKTHTPEHWHQQQKIVVLINNGIHPGEPDGIDASMMLLRDIASGKTVLSPQVVLAVIPVYNIGGALNRGAFSRVNQNGPEAYGFRGNAQNLDLNRDFTKLDSRNAAGFHQIFHWLDPHILIDNHVSDGADFQHTMTLLTTQYDKLGATLGEYLRNRLEPDIYTDMQQKGWDMFPYVNFDGYDLSRGMTQFYDPPRYSSGYAALFQCIGFVPETHMLKPFDQRVRSTYDLMVSITAIAAKQRTELLMARKKARAEILHQQVFPLTWQPDTSRHTRLIFKGFERDTIISEVTGMPRMRYLHQKPFEAPIRFFCYFKGAQLVTKPRAYVIPQGWHRVIERLQYNRIKMQPLAADTVIDMEVYRIENYTPATRPYESHFKHSNVQVKTTREKIQCLKGDYIIYTGQPGDRFLVEMLEPTGADSYFSWNFFDAILQQKEGYSNYRWEDLAADWLRKNPELKKALEEKKAAEPAFAKNANQVLNWVYRNSPYFEPSFMRYPVFRINQ